MTAMDKTVACPAWPLALGEMHMCGHVAAKSTRY
jgi:hypothetical protein